VRRTETTWSALALLLVTFHFIVPFLLLLSRVVKRNRQALVPVAATLLALRFVDLFWLTAPSFHAEGIAVHVLDLLLAAAMGSTWLACFIRQLRRWPLLPLHDPQFGESFSAIQKGQESQG
jgi:hypothetical protein